ncbi:peptidase M36 [Chytridium lagenaria]|nr:peptidase M36 [Chytridium lagenaria]
MDNTYLVHELGHGLSSRLTGGPENANCLGTVEARGMAEGWSDTLSWWVPMEVTDTFATDKVIAAYVSNNTDGIREFPYSTSLVTNPLRYSDVANKTIADVHLIGSVWSNMLFEIYWNMVNATGYDDDITRATSDAGNIRFMQNMVDGLKLQPCNPTFVEGRNAYLQADWVTNGGRNLCPIWRGFAKRGLGVSAAGYVDAFDVPARCQ